MKFEITKNNELFQLCEDNKAFIQAANDMYSFYCSSNHITKKADLSTIKACESFLKSQDYDIKRIKDNTDNQTYTVKDKTFCPNCKKMVDLKDKTLCAECGANLIELKTQKEEKIKQIKALEEELEGLYNTADYFTKIKVKKGVLLEFSTVNDKDIVRSELTKDDLPKDSFPEAMQELKSDVIEICEFPTEYESDIEVISISLKYNSRLSEFPAGIEPTSRKPSSPILT
jgi:hypothetical protein